MKKIYIQLQLLSFFFLITELCFSQTSLDQFNAAKAQYESGNYSSSIQNLKLIEQNIGPNPKVQSLLVYVYLSLNNYKNAKIELEKYKKLVPYGYSQGHKDLLSKEKLINDQINILEQNHNLAIQNKRMAEAKNAIAVTYETALRKKILETQKVNAQIIKNKELELDAYNRMINYKEEKTASDFYYNYPNSIYRLEAYKLWQERFLANAAILQDEQALNKLNTFTNTFNSKPIPSETYQKASQLYNQKWTDAYNRYNKTYLANKSAIQKKETKEWVNLFLFTGIMYGVGYGVENYLIEKTDKPQYYGEYFAAGYFTMSLIIDAPWSKTKTSRERNAAILQKVNQYSKEPNFK